MLLFDLEEGRERLEVRRGDGQDHVYEMQVSEVTATAGVPGRDSAATPPPVYDAHVHVFAADRARYPQVPGRERPAAGAQEPARPLGQLHPGEEHQERCADRRRAPRPVRHAAARGRPRSPTPVT